MLRESSNADKGVRHEHWCYSHDESNLFKNNESGGGGGGKKDTVRIRIILSMLFVSKLTTRGSAALSVRTSA